MIDFLINIHAPTHSAQRCQIMKKTLSIIHEEGLLLVGVSFLVAHSGAGFLSSFISEVIMPFIAAVLGESDWENASVTVSTLQIHWGDPVSKGLHLVVVLYIASLVLRFVRKESQD